MGWDVHRIAAGRPMILGGVTIPCEFGLEGHSDADVLAHAITDAILGAAALGDIGMHFPDSDQRWKGCDSLVFLRHAHDLAKQRGYRIVNVDSTVILERPKLKDYRLGDPRAPGRNPRPGDRSRFREIQDGGKGRTGRRRPLGGIPGDRHTGTFGTK